jgi:nanoRNase/pAp phosphatase (c-di-AMP/oligoRNAs hydrolase)
MPNEENKESWDKYQKLILSELQELKAGQSRLEDEVVIINQRLNKIEHTEVFVQDIQRIATAEQYKKLYEDVSALNKFKNNALLIFAIIQSIVGLGLWWLTYKK